MAKRAPQPRVEDYLREQAYERRAHLLDGSGRYMVRSSLGRMPYGAVLGTYLPDYSDEGTLMWVDFQQYVQTGQSPEKKPTVRRRAVGEVAIAIGARDFSTAEEIMAEGMSTVYLEDWLTRYNADKTRNSFGELRHPIVEPVQLLNDYLKHRHPVALDDAAFADIAATA